MAPPPKNKRKARCGICNNDLLLQKATGVLACVYCDLITQWPKTKDAKASVWRAAFVGDR